MNKTNGIYIDGENISPKLFNLIKSTIKIFGKINYIKIYVKKNTVEYKNWYKYSNNNKITKIIKCQNKIQKDYIDSILIQQIKGDLKKKNINSFFIISSDKIFKKTLKTIVENKKKIFFLLVKINQQLALNVIKIL